MQHATLVQLGVKWLSRQCSVVLYEAAPVKKEIPDVIGWSGARSTLIECKASRADFLKDAHKASRAGAESVSEPGTNAQLAAKSAKSKTMSKAVSKAKAAVGAGMGQRRYYLSPANVIQVEDLPPKWGLLWADKGRITIVCEAKGFAKRNLPAEMEFLAAMLRRAQIRIGSRPLSEWLRGENRLEAVRGISPNTRPRTEADALTKSTSA